MFFNENVRLPFQCGIIYTLHIVWQQFIVLIRQTDNSPTGSSTGRFCSSTKQVEVLNKHNYFCSTFQSPQIRNRTMFIRKPSLKLLKLVLSPDAKVYDTCFKFSITCFITYFLTFVSCIIVVLTLGNTVII